jgi:hypothetical protein
MVAIELTTNNVFNRLKRMVRTLTGLTCLLYIAKQC